MSFLDLVKNRHSVRNFKSTPVPDDLLHLVLEAGRLAPSACNLQPWYFIVLRGEDVKVLAKAYPRDWFLKAPAVITVCYDRNVSWKRADGKEYGEVDAAIAMDHMILMAAELGLGTCWIGAFNKEETRFALRLPNNIEPVVMTPLGYSESQPETRPRKNINDVVRWAQF